MQKNNAFKLKSLLDGALYSINGVGVDVGSIVII
jgi:hypothetical protein